MNPLKTVASRVPQLKFSKVHSPKMKSVYWRYFGFPMNDANELITKQNVVCTICQKVLTNHGNTTNLRAHLQHRHKDVFATICNENGIRIPPRKQQAKPINSVNKNLKQRKSKSITKSEQNAKIKIEYQADNSNVEMDEQTVLYETIVPMTYEDDDEVDTDQFAKVDVGNLSSDDARHDDEPSLKRHNKMGIFGPGASIEEYEISSVTLQDSIINAVITDVINLDVIFDEGVTQLLRTCNTKVNMPPMHELEAVIRDQRNEKYDNQALNYRMHSQEKYFSLGFELWHNINGHAYMSVYFNYANEAPEYSLTNQLFLTLDYNKYNAIETVFEDFNMNNCTTAIINYENEDYLTQYLHSQSN